MTLSLNFLGTGTSHGVPVIGCDCPVCTSNNPKNHRTRTSAVVTNGQSTLLIDTSPELRIQALANSLSGIDAVLFTHAHADHIFGLDDIRRFNEIQMKEIPCYGNEQTLGTIRRAFEYIFVPTQEGGGKPKISLTPVSESFQAAGVSIQPIPIFHGQLPILGYRIGNLAYITDCSSIPSESFELLQNLDVLVLGALRPKPHPTHFTIEQAIDTARQISAQHTFFIHMSHRVEHEETNRLLPNGIELAYDGLKIEVND